MIVEIIKQAILLLVSFGTVFVVWVQVEGKRPGTLFDQVMRWRHVRKIRPR